MIDERRLSARDRPKSPFKQTPLQVGEAAGVYMVAERLCRVQLLELLLKAEKRE